MTDAPRPFRLPRAAGATLLAVGLGLAGCSSSGGSAASSTTAASSSTTVASTTAPSSTTATTASTTATTASTSTTAAGPAQVTIEATVTGKQISVSSKRFAVPLNSPVTIRVTADSNQEVHLHGYDLKAEAAPGAPAVITFVAKSAGLFEVELEKTATQLFQIAVS